MQQWHRLLFRELHGMGDLSQYLPVGEVNRVP